MKLQNTNPYKNSIALILDDHILFADSFSLILERIQIFNAVHTFYDEKEILEFLKQNHNSTFYFFIDYYLKGHNSLMFINDIKRLNKGAQIIIVSSVSNPSIIKNILSYSPHGFISKSSGITTIIECIDAISSKKNYLCPIISEILKASQGIEEIPFTARELELLNYFAQGLSIDQTAEKTFLSRHTIVAHRRKMMKKTKTNSITELLAYSRQAELI